MKDLEVAEKNLDINEYYASVFFTHQAVEKILKAYFMNKLSRSPGKTHSLIYLAREAEVPREHFSLLQALTPEFVTTRYPDAAGDAPYLLYGREKASEYIKKARDLTEWIQYRMNRH